MDIRTTRERTIEADMQLLIKRGHTNTEIARMVSNAVGTVLLPEVVALYKSMQRPQS